MCVVWCGNASGYRASGGACGAEWWAQEAGSRVSVARVGGAGVQ